jgi:hypothetical protein
MHCALDECEQRRDLDRMERRLKRYDSIQEHIKPIMNFLKIMNYTSIIIHLQAATTKSDSLSFWKSPSHFGKLCVFGGGRRHSTLK